MPADVEESSQCAVFAPDDEQRITGEFTGQELPGLFHLVGSADYYPICVENRFAFPLGDFGIDVPGVGNRARTFQRHTGSELSKFRGKPWGYAHCVLPA